MSTPPAPPALQVPQVPPLTPPPEKSGMGLLLGVIGGLVVVFVAGTVGLGVLWRDAEKQLPEARTRLTLPHALDDGTYVLAQDLSAVDGEKIKAAANNTWSTEVTEGVVGRYSLRGDRTKGALVLAGMYGRFVNPGAIRDGALRGDGEARGTTTVVGPRDVTPAGSPVRISCEVLRRDGALVSITYPVCAWADANTSAVMAEMTFGSANADLDLKAAARTALRIRSETVRPIH
ncbi:hypothetical protein [Streptomyces sp. NPDC006739]|uniref:hypothetical protein n=1 Tax=Streptomyces sp. NPDC006739 TaxID=3364763 RepID=UPI0036981D8B